MIRSTLGLALLVGALIEGCAMQTSIPTPAPAGNSGTSSASAVTPAERLARYTTVKLVADESKLTPKELQMLPLLIDAARAMNDVFWLESYGDRNTLMRSISDPVVRQLVDINFGPWDRLDDNAPFVPGVGSKPAGATYYPADMTKAEFETAVAAGGARADSLKHLYTVVRRDASGKLYAIPFHQIYGAPHQLAASKLRQAAALADDPGLRNYLTLRADALLTDNYQPSDFAWMDMKNNTLDIVVGPIETYEDALFGYKAGHEGVVLIKDREWSDRLAKYAAMLPSLQRGIPVAEEYKRETPGGASDLNAYDVVYVAGEANTGAKTIAINL
ncbi:MAG: Zn-dependent hydrolase, partial [Gemmatimonadaceae bacterium]